MGKSNDIKKRFKKAMVKIEADLGQKLKWVPCARQGRIHWGYKAEIPK